MKKRSFFIVLFALILLMSALAFYGCQREKVFLHTNDVKNIREDVANGLIGFRWLSEYDDSKPTLVVFHGEIDENEDFTINLNKSVYNENVTYASSSLNVDTIGWKGQGLKTTADGEYFDMEMYWTNVAEFNVAVLHAERFLCEGTDNSIIKIYSTYKSRYLSNGLAIDRNYGFSLTEVISAVYKEELDKIQLSGSTEIRFLGYGVGANLALACADYLYSFDTYNTNYRPDRITLCDPCLSDKPLSFDETSFGKYQADKGTVGIVSAMTGKIPTCTIIEMIETEEVSGDTKIKAYPDNVSSGDKYTTILNNTASLIFSESYGLKMPSGYKAKNRIAFDWYIYSVIGSDDNANYNSASQKYAVGYPHNISEVDTATKVNVNWGKNKTRPILNYRRLTNDARNDAGSTYGKNFGIGAWTPTEYLIGLRGVQFTQKEGAGTSSGEVDKHGNFVYKLSDYVLGSFKSENYQYSQLNETTVLTGVVYVDENSDGWKNDTKYGIRTTIFVTITDSNGKILCGKTSTNTDEYGRYTIVVHDYVPGDTGVAFAAIDGGGEIKGFNAKNTDLTVTIELYTPKGYTSRAESNTAVYWYNSLKMNSAKNGEISISVSKTRAYSVVVNNIFLVKISD